MAHKYYSKSIRDEWPSGLKQRSSSSSSSRRPRAALWLRPALYGALNIASASGIVLANKLVFSTYGFKFTCALTWIHTAVTLLGMQAFLAAGMFTRKPIRQAALAPLAAAYVGYIVLNNLSLNINTVGFYQVMKIAVAPTVLVLELLMFRKAAPPRVVASVLLVCLGIGVATVTDTKIAGRPGGVAVGLGATVVTALYQIWVGTKQRSLCASSMQLLHQYTPQATLMLGVLVPLMEPVGWSPRARSPDTLLGFRFTAPACAAILVSALLGLLVSLSTFLVIGVTSSLTYNVVGHLKTVIILAGGCLMFGDEMPPKKLAGVAIAMAGIVWYTHLNLQAVAQGKGKEPGASPPQQQQQQRQPLLPTTATSNGAGGGGGGPAPTAAAGAAAGGSANGSFRSADAAGGWHPASAAYPAAAGPAASASPAAASAAAVRSRAMPLQAAS